MARVELAPGVFDDFDRFLDHLHRFQVPDGHARIGEIIQAIQILTHSPLIGRPVRDGKHELIIGRGSHGYIALYRFLPGLDIVFVLAIRSQRERSFSRS